MATMAVAQSEATDKDREVNADTTIASSTSDQILDPAQAQMQPQPSPEVAEGVCSESSLKRLRSSPKDEQDVPTNLNLDHCSTLGSSKRPRIIVEESSPTTQSAQTSSANLLQDCSPKPDLQKQTIDETSAANLPAPMSLPAVSPTVPSLHKSELSESDLTFSDHSVGYGRHSIVFHVTAAGREYALKIHRYDYPMVESTSYPKHNSFFEAEAEAYTRLSHLQEAPNAIVPKCYGYIDFTIPPQLTLRNHPPRHILKSRHLEQAVYLDFLFFDNDFDDEPAVPKEDKQWREYFRNKARQPILRGILLEYIPAREFDLWPHKRFTKKVHEEGRKMLHVIHKAGVVHGDVENTDNIIYRRSEKAFVWLDFSFAKTAQQLGEKRFSKEVRQELRNWDWVFHTTLEALKDKK